MRLGFEAKGRKGCFFCLFTKKKNKTKNWVVFCQVLCVTKPKMVIVKLLLSFLPSLWVYHFSWIPFSIFVGLWRCSLILYYLTTMDFKAHPQFSWKGNKRKKSECNWWLYKCQTTRRWTFLSQLVIHQGLGCGVAGPVVSSSLGEWLQMFPFV